MTTEAQLQDQPERTAITPGSLLRKARLARGMELTDLAAVTRIPRTMLEHLEQDQYDEYSAEVFVRGHLSNLSRELRLDPTEVLTAYDRQVGKRLDYSDVGESKGSSRRKTTEQEFVLASDPSVGVLSRVQSAHWMALGLIVLGLIIVSFLASSGATAQDPADFPTSSDQDWQLEQEVEQTRWLLEQPSEHPRPQ